MEAAFSPRFVVQAFCPHTELQIPVIHIAFVMLWRKETTASLTATLTGRAGKGGEHSRAKEAQRKRRTGSEPHSSAPTHQGFAGFANLTARIYKRYFKPLSLL